MSSNTTPLPLINTISISSNTAKFPLLPSISYNTISISYNTISISSNTAPTFSNTAPSFIILNSDFVVLSAVRQYYTSHLPYVSQQPSKHQQLAASILQENAVAYTAQQQWEVEWNQYGLKSHRSPQVGG